MKRDALKLAVLFVALFLPPVFGDAFYINVASQVLIAAIFAMSLNLLVGYGGMTSLGHAAYLGTSAYIVAFLTSGAGWGFAPAALVSILATTVMAACFGAIALRGFGISFLMITLALGQTIWGVAFRWSSVTGGDNGIAGVPRPKVFGASLAEPISFYIAISVLFLIAMFAMSAFTRSGLGVSLQGVRDQPRRMAILGHNVWLVKWITFVIAGFWGAVSGIAFIAYHGYIHPQSLALTNSAEVLLMVIAGGAGTLFGPVVGAIVVVVLKMIVSAYIVRWVTLLGITFIVIVMFLPEGLVPGIGRLYRRLLKRTPPIEKPEAETE